MYCFFFLPETFYTLNCVNHELQYTCWFPGLAMKCHPFEQCLNDDHLNSRRETSEIKWHGIPYLAMCAFNWLMTVKVVVSSSLFLKSLWSSRQWKDTQLDQRQFFCHEDLIDRVTLGILWIVLSWNCCMSYMCRFIRVYLMTCLVRKHTFALTKHPLISMFN